MKKLLILILAFSSLNSFAQSNDATLLGFSTIVKNSPPSSGKTGAALDAIIKSKPNYLGAFVASGTDSYIISTTIITAYTTNLSFDILIPNTNTGAATINVASLGVKSLVKNVNTALTAGDLQGGKYYRIYYDGTNFQVGNNYIGTGAVNQVSYWTGTTSLSGSADYLFDPTNKKIIGGGGSTSPSGSQSITWGDTNINKGVFGSACFGELSEIESTVGAGLSCGERVYVSGYGGVGIGRGTKAAGAESFIGGRYSSSISGKTNLKAPQSNGLVSFGFYGSDGNQIDNHGVNADFSAVLGGTNPNIPSGATNSVIVGGNRMKMLVTDTSMVYVPNLRIRSGTGVGTRMLTVDATGHVSNQAIPSGGGGGGDALVANPLSQFAATTSAQLAGVISDETGSGGSVFATSPTLVTPVLGVPTSVTLTNATGLPLTTGVTGTLPIANGGTGTTTPGIVAGTNVTVSGTWPNQTINAPVMTATVGGAVPTPPNNTTTFLRGDGTFVAPATAIDQASASTAGATITLDFNNQTQRMFVGSATFATAKTIAVSNTTNTLVFSFIFEITNLAATLTFPSGWLMADSNFSALVWTPPVIGKYEMGATRIASGNWYIKIIGPFN